MTEKWWLLSGLSYIGPQPEVDAMQMTGFYKKMNDENLIYYIEYNHAPYDQYKQHFLDFLEDMAVVDQNSFNGKVIELLNGSTFGKTMDRFYAMSRLMKSDKKNDTNEVLISGHLYSRALFDALVAYEVHWPIDGLLAYDMCNLVLLLKIGLGMEFCSQEKADATMEQIIDRVSEEYDDALTIGYYSMMQFLEKEWKSQLKSSVRC